MSGLAQAIEGRLVGWAGLPPDVDRAALAAVDARWTDEPGRRVRGSRAFEVVRGERDEAPEVLEAWIPAGATAVASLEFQPPPTTEHAAVLADLEEPDLTLRSNHFETGAVVRDHVHAARGITVSVAEPFEDESRGLYVVYVQLYPPTSTQDFTTGIGQSGDVLRPHSRPL